MTFKNYTMNKVETLKIVYRTAKRCRIKTVYSIAALRDFIKRCYRNKWQARATDGQNECAAVFVHEESGLTWYSE